MALTTLYDFMQVLTSTRKPPTKNLYFSKHILFTTIYLLQEQELNSRIYSKQELIMSIFVQATDSILNIAYIFVINFFKVLGDWNFI
jgi:hypothetical protein